MSNPFRYVSMCGRACIGVLVLGIVARLASSSDNPRVLLLVEDSASIYRFASLGFEDGFGHAATLRKIFVDPDGKALASLSDELAAAPPQLIVAVGTNTALAAHAKFPSYPILYCLAFDPVHNALTGKNIGGFAFQVDLSRQIAEMQRALPSATRVGAIFNEPVSGSTVRKAKDYLRPGVKLVLRDAQNARDAGQMIDTLAGAIDTFWLLWDPVIANPANFRHLVDFCLRNHVALVSPATPFVEAGALMSISPDYFETGRATGLIALDIISGKIRVGDVGSKAPPGPLLTINDAVAKRLGIVIPKDLPAEILSAR